MSENAPEEWSQAGEARVIAASPRAAWLGALLGEPGSVLMHYDPRVAHVQSAGGEQIVLLTSASSEEIQARIAAIMQHPPPGPLQLVVVNAGEELMAVLRDERGFGKQASLWRITPQGALDRVLGTPSKALSRAEAAVPSATPLDDREALERASRATFLRRDAARFAAAVSTGYPPVTTAIAVLCALILALCAYWGASDENRLIWSIGGNHRELVLAGEWWRLFGSAFFHGNLMHLTFNMLALLSLGRMLERLLGRTRYLSLYALSALGGSLATDTLGRSVSVGASGAIWGVMMATFALILRPRGLLPALAVPQMRQRMWMPLLLNVSISFVPGIDYHAHFGGGLVGFLLVFSGVASAGVAPVWSQENRSARKASDILWAVVATILSIAMLASLAVTIWAARPWELRKPVEFTRVVVGGTGISVELPEALERQRLPTPIAGPPTFVYGELPKNPVAADLQVGVFQEPPPAAEVERLLQQAVAAQARQCKNPSVRPHLETLGARRYASAQCALGKDLRMSIYYTILEDRAVNLTVVAVPDRPAGWLGVEKRIAASLSRVP
jgi:membrane associated rhomboid family serine protease